MFPPGTEAASLDIAKAYQNSPITPIHKKYLCVFCKNHIYIQHDTIEGLATAGGIQGAMADTMVALLKFHKVKPTIKWVDNFVFFRSPQFHSSNSSCMPSFNFNLSTILGLTKPLGFPWHPILKKGHDFQSFFSYVSFKWNYC